MGILPHIKSQFRRFETERPSVITRVIIRKSKFERAHQASHQVSPPPRAAAEDDEDDEEEEDENDEPVHDLDPIRVMRESHRPMRLATVGIVALLEWHTESYP